MKQIIGYIKYDYMNIKYGMLLMLVLFGIISVVFSMQTGEGAVAYMLFGGLILAGTAFNTTMQMVSFAALAPGSIFQKVMGRYLGGVFCLIASASIGLLSTGVVKLAGVSKEAGAWGGSMQIPILLILFGVSLLFLAVQNVLLYLLTPVLGIQAISLVRMVPGFMMFFGVMKIGDLDIISGILQNPWPAAGIILGTGILSIVISIFLSCLVIRNRDNV